MGLGAREWGNCGLGVIWSSKAGSGGRIRAFKNYGVGGEWRVGKSAWVEYVLNGEPLSVSFVSKFHIR